MIFFCSGGKDSVRVFCSLPLSLHSFLILVGRRLQRPSCVCTGTTVAFSLAVHWIALQPVPHAKKKKMQPVEVMGTGCHLSYCLVGRRQLKSTAMLNDLLGIRMPLQPLIWAAGRSFFSHSVHATSASLFQLLNDGFTSEIQLS